MPENELALISRARTALEKAKTICEASEIRDQAAAVARYLKRKKGAEEAARHANEIRLRAERKIGKLDKPRRSVPGGDPSYDGTGSDNGGVRGRGEGLRDRGRPFHFRVRVIPCAHD